MTPNPHPASGNGDVIERAQIASRLTRIVRGSECLSFDEIKTLKTAAELLAPTLGTLPDFQLRRLRQIVELWEKWRNEDHEDAALVSRNDVCVILDALQSKLSEGSAEKWLGELLAVIHRDGGHYRAEHGNEKAVRDAHKIWAELKLRSEGSGDGKMREAEWEGYRNGLIAAGNIKSRFHCSDVTGRVINDIRRQIDEKIAAIPALEATPAPSPHDYIPATAEEAAELADVERTGVKSYYQQPAPSPIDAEGMREALRFYANEDNYKPNQPITVQEDRGEIAREALAVGQIKKSRATAIRSLGDRG